MNGDTEKFPFYNILFAANGAYYLYVQAAMLSAMLHCEKKCHFYIMEADWTARQKALCAEFIALCSGHTVNFLDVDEKALHFLKPFKNSYTTFYRLLPQEYLPADVDRILYLDADLIVRKDIADYYCMDFADCFRIAVFSRAEFQPDFRLSDMDAIPSADRHRRANTISNPGVCLLNIGKLREAGIHTGWYARFVDSLPDRDYFYDEGILNAAFWGKTRFVEPWYYETMIGFIDTYREIYQKSGEERAQNYCELYAKDLDHRRELTIVHFVCSRHQDVKPWDCVYDRTAGAVYTPAGERIRPSEEPYFAQWWEIARQLPLDFYEAILSRRQANALGALSRQKFWFENASGFLLKIALDFLGANRLRGFLYRFWGKSISILKAQDEPAAILFKACPLYQMHIVFRTSAVNLASLPPPEFEQCRLADVIVNCNVHGDSNPERDGVRAVMIQDILDDPAYDMRRDPLPTLPPLF